MRNKEANLESIDVNQLTKICGGTTPAQDVKNMVKGAAEGALTGGPWGAIFGTIKGSLPGFYDAGKQLLQERQRGKELDKKREEMKKKHPEYFT